MCKLSAQNRENYPLTGLELQVRLEDAESTFIFTVNIYIKAFQSGGRYHL